jgi:hypothetical protein
MQAVIKDKLMYAQPIKVWNKLHAYSADLSLSICAVVYTTLKAITVKSSITVLRSKKCQIITFALYDIAC